MDLSELLAAQGGVVTYEQALAAGASRRQLGPSRLLVRVRTGVYAERSRVEAAGPAEQAALAVAALRLRTGVDVVAAGRTAARIHGLPVLGVSLRLDVVERKELRPRHHGSSATLTAEDVQVLHDVPVTGLARTTVDVARRHGFAAGVVTADAALARGVSRDELRAAAERCRGWSGLRTARRVIAFADGRAETALESLGRARFEEHGLPPSDLQVWLGGDDAPIARVDHYWAAHRTVAEGDGALKYATQADLFAEKRREDRLREAGFEVVRYTWDEVLRTPEVVVARVWAAFARAEARAAA